MLKQHPVIKTTLERAGVANKVKFKPGNLIFVLPDPAYRESARLMLTELFGSKG